jgi:23S rRNA G2069 N7-methylase RlmK/C1962 C5-methylase RlmI
MQSQLYDAEVLYMLCRMLAPCCRPEAFGQHPNAEISYLIEDSKALLDGLLGLAPRGGTIGSSSGSGGRRREDLVEAIANDLLDQVGAVCKA